MDASNLFDVKVTDLQNSISHSNFHILETRADVVGKGKVVLVTGGAKGIGRMISEGFVTNGAKVYISSRDAKACGQACRELNALGKDLVP